VVLREQLAEKADWVAVHEDTPVRHVRALRLVEAGTWAPEAARAQSFYPFAKRLTDFALALLLLIVCAPLLALVATAVRLDSQGPAIFRQWRIGLHGQAFRIWKFRTLSVVEDGDDITQVTKPDPRVTRVGDFLRRTSIDELPQLINVLRGEMSLVGPRPHARAHDQYFGGRIENYTLRHRVKPGITGWAQVNGLRGETATLEEMRRRVGFDLWYVRRARFALDLRILLATPAVVLRGRNAW
jgi:exopolysaccharide biosynthesis polyprenyl glycosylphosphotransferase